MIQFFALRLLLAAFAAHAALGCCWHHAHRVQASDATSRAAAPCTTCSAHACPNERTAAAAHDDSGAPATPPAECCEEAKCNFARIESSSLVTHVHPVNLLATPTLLEGLADSHVSSAVQQDCGTPPWAPRLHLFLGVLQI